MSDFDWSTAAYRPLPGDPRPQPPTPTPPPVPAPVAHMPGEVVSPGRAGITFPSSAFVLADAIRGVWWR